MIGGICIKCCVEGCENEAIKTIPFVCTNSSLDLRLHDGETFNLSVCAKHEEKIIIPTEISYEIKWEGENHESI